MRVRKHASQSAAPLQGNSSWQPYSAATVLQAAPDVEPACVQPVPDPASRRPPVWQGTLAQDTHTVNLVRSDGALWLDEASAEAKAGCLRETFLHGTHLIELDYFSRHGEDGILAAVFRCIGHRDKCAPRDHHLPRRVLGTMCCVGRAPAT